MDNKERNEALAALGWQGQPNEPAKRNRKLDGNLDVTRGEFEELKHRLEVAYAQIDGMLGIVRGIHEQQQNMAKLDEIIGRRITQFERAAANRGVYQQQEGTVDG